MRIVARCGGEIRRRLRRFDEILARWRQGLYAPEIHAADLLFARAGETPSTATPGSSSHIDRPLSVLVILEPSAAGGPHPNVVGGRLCEPYFALTDADEAALESALRLRDQGGEPVTIHVAVVGTTALILLLRETLALSVASALLLETPDGDVPPDRAAASLAQILQKRGASFDLILGPAGRSDVEEGLLTPLTAARLGVPYWNSCAVLTAHHAESEGVVRLFAADDPRGKTRSLPAVVTVEAGLALRDFLAEDYFQSLSRPIHVEPWPTPAATTIRWLADGRTEGRKDGDVLPNILTSPQAADWLRAELGVQTHANPRSLSSAVPIRDVAQPWILENLGAIAVLAADVQGGLSGAAGSVLRAMQAVAGPNTVVMLVPPEEESQCRAAGELVALGAATVLLVPAPAEILASADMAARFLVDFWPVLTVPPRVVVGEAWVETAFAALAPKAGHSGDVALRAKRVHLDGDCWRIETARGAGSLRTVRELRLQAQQTHWLSLTNDAETIGPAAAEIRPPDILRWRPSQERFYGRPDIQRLLAELKHETGVVRLADAEFIIDVGYGVGNRDGYEQVVDPLEKTLRSLGVKNVLIGGSRKVTEELHLLPDDRQIGQSGVSVNPRILLALGVSGAPQHLDYIGSRATILAFNRDPEAPLMTLNQRKPLPRVFPIVGDLFETVPVFIAGLRRETAATGSDPA